ncbi:MAG TPA: hypothetical protein VK179_19330 [Bacteroidales bacterium]|nr:hypothetical protein [Bacteroidales bacterium]
MKKAVIYYTSKTGITKKLGENIKDYLNEKGISTEFQSTDEILETKTEGADYVLLGCWTGGLMLLFQGPTKKWIGFAKKLPELDPSKTILFTTYKIRTGSMFRNMKKHLKTKSMDSSYTEIKSKNSTLDAHAKILLDKFITN